MEMKLNSTSWKHNLKQWAIDNPISNLESLRSGYYKDFDGHLGIPNDIDELENITKLILPLGDSFRGELPSELGNLIALTELSIFARKVKDIPIEIFQLPNLKKLSITVRYTYKVNDDNLKVLIDNGCRYISINALHMNTKYTYTIKDETIINYLLANKLCMTSVDFGIHPEDLYRIAKNIAFENEDMAHCMLQFLDSKFDLGFDAFVSAKNMNKKEIGGILDFIEAEYEMSDDIEEYVDMLLLVGLSIVEEFPLLALHIYNNIQSTYEIIGSLPGEIENLFMDIVFYIAQYDLTQALELINTLGEVDYSKYEALKRINDLDENQTVKEMMNQIRSEIMKYGEDYFDR